MTQPSDERGDTRDTVPAVRPRVLIGHEQIAIGKAVACILGPHGFDVQVVQSGDAVARVLQTRRWDGLVIDVAMPGRPSYELTELAKCALEQPVPAVVLVATVHRRTSYKRRPARLYGADDYVEIHRLGEQLPGKLWALVGAEPARPHGLDEQLHQVLGGDPGAAFPRAAGAALAEVLVADVVLRHADGLVMAMDSEGAHAIVERSLSTARARYKSLIGERAVAVDRAFARALVRLGLAEAST
jgi:CheY-like chemotaxis protein